MQPQIDCYLYRAITTVKLVLPSMLARGSGALLFTTGGSAVYPNPMMGNVGIAMARLRNWVHTLHAKLSDKGIYAGHISIDTSIGSAPGTDADTIAQVHWNMEQKRDRVEAVFDTSRFPYRLHQVSGDVTTTTCKQRKEVCPACRIRRMRRNAR